ncbi:MAG: P-II family nitrogen regulator [Candidatus Hatepunaea meridiana]|nr:P-II family nitrogen regulator [Candidatus Hatepunaea meridiana]
MSAMKLVIIILNREEYLDELLEAFVELDVRGATVVDSVGMGQIISNKFPIFGGLRSLMEGARPYNKTILTVVSEEKVELITAEHQKICGSLDEPGTGLIFTVPVDFVKGLTGKSLS